jgi:molecular chaperone GrpE
VKSVKKAAVLRQLLWLLTGFGTGWLLRQRPRVDAAGSITTAGEAIEPGGSGNAEAVGDGAAPGITDEVAQLYERIAALQASVSALDKQWGRAGREQLKANTLAEAQQQQVRATLEQLHEQSGRRESELAALREQLRVDQPAQRLLMIGRILPALDGLDEALASGVRLLERAPQITPLAQISLLSVRQRLAIAPGRAVPVQDAALPVSAAALTGSDDWHAAVEAWLHGLRLVRERLLELLDAEDVQPIAAQGEPFDPHRHIAIDSVPATEDAAAGTVVVEYRRGYAQGERLLRPAEVVVARASDDAQTETESA